MTRRILLLRGINLGRANRLPMADLRAALEAAGFANVRTYLQSGNVVLDGDGDPAVAIKALIDVPVVTRTVDELDAAVAANPFPEEAAQSPKFLMVTFWDGPAPAPRVEPGPGERVAAVGNEVFSWHPEGVARSKLALALVPSGRNATTRNWNTVLKLQELAHG